MSLETQQSDKVWYFVVVVSLEIVFWWCHQLILLTHKTYYYYENLTDNHIKTRFRMARRWRKVLLYLRYLWSLCSYDKHHRVNRGLHEASLKVWRKLSGDLITTNINSQKTIIMIAIQTKYLPCTNHKPSRIKAYRKAVATETWKRKKA